VSSKGTDPLVSLPLLVVVGLYRREIGDVAVSLSLAHHQKGYRETEGVNEDLTDLIRDESNSLGNIALVSLLFPQRAGGTLERHGQPA
jgi:hypothetical protein